MAGTEVPVLIVGGSLVGLTASVLLAANGVPHLLVERHRGTAIHPRAASFHQRTMEIFRSVGLQSAIEQAAAREFVQNGAIVAVDSLAGRELACFYRSYNDGVEALSPASRLFITQLGLEPLLRARAEAMGAEHRFGTELDRFIPDSDGVTAWLRPRDGVEQAVRARYLIAADGARSPVRRQLGIGMDGRGSFADCLTIYFKADLRDLIGERNLSVVYVNRPDLLAFFRFAITRGAGFLAIFSGGWDAQAAGGSLPSPERCAALVRSALGVEAGFPVEVENVQPWSAAADTAAAFRSGPVFLAGDAAHVMPPTGGFGGNTGIADVHNLAWKLAMVLDGAAAPALLDSYEAERRPLCRLTVEQAYRRYVDRVDPTLPADGLAPPLDDAAIELGAIYRSRAVLADGEAADDDLIEDPGKSSGRPGTRVPHLWLDQAGERRSTLDLAGRRVTLVAGRGGRAWTAAAAKLAAAQNCPLAAYRIAPDGDFADPEQRFEQVVGTGAEGALLLRPDGVIAWRATDATTDPRETLAAAMRRLMFRT